MAVLKTENSIRGVTSIQTTGAAAGTATGAVSIFPCAMQAIAQSSSSGIVPPCSHACSGVQSSAAAMNSQTASDKAAVARKRQLRFRRFNGGFLYCKSFAIRAEACLRCKHFFYFRARAGLARRRQDEQIPKNSNRWVTAVNPLAVARRDSISRRKHSSMATTAPHLVQTR
jgi:hypothetical protein